MFELYRHFVFLATLNSYIRELQNLLFQHKGSGMVYTRTENIFVYLRCETYDQKWHALSLSSIHVLTMFRNKSSFTEMWSRALISFYSVEMLHLGSWVSTIICWENKVSISSKEKLYSGTEKSFFYFQALETSHKWNPISEKKWF